MKALDVANDLGELVKGEVLDPSANAYDAARRAWNGTADAHPQAIVRVRDAADVAAVLRYAADTGVDLAVRGGGHSVAGFSTGEGIVLDLAGMRGVTVNGQARRARAQGGARWADFDAATWPERLLTTGGLVSSTGVAGLTLGGGIGWLTRLCGLSCDSLVAAEVVLPSGEIVEAGAPGHEDLLWALRGGGGNFGVVTRFDFRLTPVREVAGGLLLFPLERLQEIGDGFREVTDSAPDELSTMLVFLFGPAADFVPAELQGRPCLAVAACHAGGADAMARDLRPVLGLAPAVDLTGPMEYPELQSMFDADVPAGDRYHFKGGFANAISQDMLEIVAAHLERAPGTRCEVDLHHMGGVSAREPEGGSAFPDRSAALAYNLIAAWTDPGQDDDHRAWTRGLASDLAGFGPAATYVNFSGDTMSTEGAYGAGIASRLATVKRRYDPGNLLRRNHNIQPA